LVAQNIAEVSSESAVSGGDCVNVEPEQSGRDAVEAIKSRVAAAVTAGIRAVSVERDREEIVRWFIRARDILARDAPKKEIAKALYQSIDTRRFAQVLRHTFLTSLRNYRAANLPLALKAAIPVTVVSAALVGLQGAGLAAFGGAVGLPVVLLLFLGTAGVTSVVEAFLRDREIRDPLTRLLLALVAFETARRAKKELIEALRADAQVPQRAEVPEEDAALLEYLVHMDPTAFERHVMTFFEKDGYPVGVTSRSNDFGVDGYVLHPDGLIIVQCKRYGPQNPVGRPEVQQFKGVIEEQHAYRGFLVSTSRFTREASQSAEKSNRVVLVDGDELVRWHEDGATWQRANERHTAERQP
jgi:HJR/Mrr/RecB family endonuclease